MNLMCQAELFHFYLFFRLSKEKQLQSKLEDEISSLKTEVASANEGLAAAGRLSEQLDNKAQVIATLKQELKARDEHLKKAQGGDSSGWKFFSATFHFYI